MKYPLDEVKEAVEKGEVTGDQIAELCGVHRSTVFRAVTGKIDPPDSTVRRYFEALLAIRAEKAAGEVPAKKAA